MDFGHTYTRTYIHTCIPTCLPTCPRSSPTSTPPTPVLIPSVSLFIPSFFFQPSHCCDLHTYVRTYLGGIVPTTPGGFLLLCSFFLYNPLRPVACPNVFGLVLRAFPLIRPSPALAPQKESSLSYLDLHVVVVAKSLMLIASCKSHSQPPPPQQQHYDSHVGPPERTARDLTLTDSSTCSST